jgi:hypothetical protein
VLLREGSGSVPIESGSRESLQDIPRHRRRKKRSFQQAERKRLTAVPGQKRERPGHHTIPKGHLRPGSNSWNPVNKPQRLRRGEQKQQQITESYLNRKCCDTAFSNRKMDKLDHDKDNCQQESGRPPKYAGRKKAGSRQPIPPTHRFIMNHKHDRSSTDQ